MDRYAVCVYEFVWLEWASEWERANECVIYVCTSFIHICTICVSHARTQAGDGHGFLSQLLNLFIECEQRNDRASLHTLFIIMRTLCMSCACVFDLCDMCVICMWEMRDMCVICIVARNRTPSFISVILCCVWLMCTMCVWLMCTMCVCDWFLFCAVLLNDATIFEILFRDNMIMNMFGILECTTQHHCSFYLDLYFNWNIFIAIF